MKHEGFGEMKRRGGSDTLLGRKGHQTKGAIHDACAAVKQTRRYTTLLQQSNKSGEIRRFWVSQIKAVRYYAFGLVKQKR